MALEFVPMHQFKKYRFPIDVENLFYEIKQRAPRPQPYDDRVGLAFSLECIDLET